MIKDTPTQTDKWTHGQLENGMPLVANHHLRHENKLL